MRRSYILEEAIEKEKKGKSKKKVTNHDNNDYEDKIHKKKCIDEMNNSYYNTLDNLRKTLLYEYTMNLFNKSLGIQLEDGFHENLKKNLVSNFIEEQGTTALLNRFKTKSYLLSECYRIVNEYSDIMLESKKKKCGKDCKDEEEIEVDTSQKDDFYDDIDTDDVDEIASLIKSRVSNSVNEFVRQNAQEQMDLKDTIDQTQQNIQNSPDDSIKEEAEMYAKKKLYRIKDSKVKGIFESMVQNLSVSSYKNTKLKDIYCENGKLNVESVVETAEIIYTFLEMVNSTEMIDLNENYIADVLQNLKR